MMEDVEKSDKRLKIGLYLWSGLLVLLILILFLFFGKGQVKNNKIIETKVTETPKPELEWKSFEDSTNKWKIKYPGEWKEPSQTKQLVEFITSKDNSIDVLVFEDDSKLIADYLSKFDEQSKTAWEGQASLKVMSTRKTVINDLNCIQREEEVLAAGFTRIATYFKSGNKVVVVYLNPVGNGDVNLERDIYNRVLENFEFIK